MLNTNQIYTLFSYFQQENPSPKCELYYTNPYTLLVAVMLSAQSTDIRVNRVTTSLFKQINTPQQMLDLGSQKLKHYIYSIGLFNIKANNVIALTRILIDQYHGMIPQYREALELLPGVGRKTANVVLNVAFGYPTLAVDTHVFRVANRIGLAKEKTPVATEQCLLEVIPQKFMLHAHQWIVLHGRYVCTAKKPKCNICQVYSICQYNKKRFFKLS